MAHHFSDLLFKVIIQVYTGGLVLLSPSVQHIVVDFVELLRNI